MEKEGEGAVCYIVKENQNLKKEVISIFKLKTTEYLIYRFLRESLKKYFSAGGGETGKFLSNNIIINFR